MSASGAPIDPKGFEESRVHRRNKLDSWKGIADYLGREVRTVQRWEKTEGLPVHRHEHQKKSTVYAYTNELDDWRKNRQPKDDPVADAAFVPEPDVAASLETADGDATPGVVEPSRAEEFPPAPFEERPGPSRRLWKWLGVLTATALCCFAAYRVYRALKPRPSLTISAKPIETTKAQKVRLIVLPFKNLSNDPKQDYFSAGLTDEMITRLSNVEPQYLKIIAATSSNAFAGKPISEIRRALDVQYVLEGSVRRQGKRVRIDAQLIQVSDQTHLWADKYDRDLTDILQVQDDVATAVADRIITALDIRRIAQMPVTGNDTQPPPATSGEALGANDKSKKWIDFTKLDSHSSSIRVDAPVNPGAYDAYLRGRFYWTNRGDLHKSIEAYQQAIQKDSRYARAYAGLASSYALLGQVPYDDLAPSDAKPEAREAAKRALELDPNLAEAHAVLGNVAFSYDWNFDAAEIEFQSAMSLDPNNPLSHHWYGHYLMMRNRLPEALEQNSVTLELDPVSPLFNTTRAEMKYHMRDYNAAIEQGRRTIEQYPNYPLAYIWIGSAYRQKKMYREALDSFSQGRRLSGNHPAMIALHGHALAVSGDAVGARQALEDLKHLAQTRYVSSLYFAMIHLGLGENSTALELLDKAYNERTDRLVYLGVEPMADPLRSDPRFTQLLHKIGIQ